MSTKVPVASSIRLKSTKKYSYTSNVSTRIRPAADTLAEIVPIAKQIGVTRISDITYLDKLCIPNFSAVLPGTEDSIWVYSGKGHTCLNAKAGALMEAIERYSSLSQIYSKGFIQGSYLQLSKSFNKLIHPAEVVEPVNEDFYDKSIIDFVPGYDLQNKETVLVPAQLALSKYSAKTRMTSPFPYSHTNGLASGNVLEEAICHALCEVIERDAASIADLCASFVPFTILKTINNSLKTNILDASVDISRFVDDTRLYSEIDISELLKECEPVNYLIRKFTDAGIPLRIKDITQDDIGIPTFVASSVEWITDNYGYFAKGFGTNPDARIALIRAITEVTQTRAVNIQGARDDLRRIQYNHDDEIYRRKWQFMPTALSSTSKRKDNKKFSEIKSYSNVDILHDIQLILSRLKSAGLKRAIVVDLTDPTLNIPVVRAIVPGLETFEVAKLFTGEEALMGRRAKEHFSRFNS